MVINPCSIGVFPACHGWYSSRGSFRSCNTRAHWQIQVAVDLVSGVFFETTWTGAIRLRILGGSNKAAKVWRFWEISLMNSELVGLVIWWPLMFQDCVANNLSSFPRKTGRIGFWPKRQPPKKLILLTTLWSIVRSSSVTPGWSNPTNHH